ASPGAALAGDADAARHHLARVRPEAISLSPSGSPEVDVRAAQRFVSSDEVVRPRELMTEVLVDPQDQVFRRFVEFPNRIACSPRISGTQDLLEDRENRSGPVSITQGPRGLRDERAFTDRERLQVVDCGP